MTSVWAPVPDSLQEVQTQPPITEVHIDGLVIILLLFFS